MKTLSVVLLLFLLTAPAQALGLKGQIAAMLADYDDLVERIGKVRAARAEGYSSDGKTVLNLMKESSDLNSEAMRFTKNELSESDVILMRALVTATTSLRTMMEMELSFYIHKDAGFLAIATKHEEAWKLADAMMNARRKP